MNIRSFALCALMLLIGNVFGSNLVVQCYNGLCSLVDETKQALNIKIAPTALTFRSPTLAAEALYAAQEQINTDDFAAILDHAARNFSHEQFIEFIMQANKENFTALMVASAFNDTVQIALIFKALKAHLAADQDALFKYLNYRSKIFGYNCLTLASDSASLDTVRAITDGALALMTNKENALTFLNTADFENENNPLILLAYDSTSDALEYFVLRVQRYFGKDSKEYDAFINYQDNEGANALYYSYNPHDQIFLENNGARQVKPRSQAVKEANKLGKLLLDNMYRGQLGDMKKIINFAMEQYPAPQKNNLFNEFFNNTVDSSGSTPLLRACGMGNMPYVQLFLATIIKRYGNSTFDMYNLLRNSTNTGKTALFLTIEERHYEIAKLLLDTFREFVLNKYFVYMYLNRKDQLNHFNVLTMSEYNSTGESIFRQMTQLILEAMNHYFPIKSRAFYLYVNSPDSNGYTPLDYTNSPELTKLLQQYGAVEGSLVHGMTQFVEDIMCTITGACKKALEVAFMPRQLMAATQHQIIRMPAQHISRETHADFLAKQLLAAQKKAAPGEFKSTLNRPSRAEFEQFITTKNEQGWNPLMVAIGMSDAQELDAILKAIDRLYGNDYQTIYSILHDTSTKEGYSALLIAAHRGERTVIDLLINFIKKHLAAHPQKFFDIISQSDTENSDFPLELLAWNNASYGLNALVNAAKEVLRRQPALLKNFLNQLDNLGNSSLFYIRNSQDKVFLKNAGAQVIESKNPPVKQALKMNRDIIESLHRGQYATAKATIAQALRDFNGNDDLLTLVFATQDENGWDILAHAIATSNDKALIQYLVETIATAFKNPIARFNALANIDQEGLSNLSLALQRKNYDFARLLINEMQKISTQHDLNPLQFHLYMTFENELTGASPLITIMRNNNGDEQAFAMIKFIVEKMAEIYGRNSRAFATFINATDFDGKRALDYASTDEIGNYLKSYGAQEGITTN